MSCFFSQPTHELLPSCHSNKHLIDVETMAVGGRLPCGAQRLQGRGWTRRPHVGTSSSQGQCPLSHAAMQPFCCTCKLFVVIEKSKLQALLCKQIQSQARNLGVVSAIFTLSMLMQAAQAKATLMSLKCMLMPCESCSENLAYAPPSALFDAKQATANWASQKQSYVFGMSLYVNVFATI